MSSVSAETKGLLDMAVRSYISIRKVLGFTIGIFRVGISAY
jgi:hypothetical protein